MKSITQRIVCGLSVIIALAGAEAARATTNYVTPGESIQAAVTAASPGDTIIIFGGTYTESVTVPKWLSILRVAGQTVFITGNVTYQAIAATTNAPLIVSNLKIGGDTSKKLILNNCANVVVNNVDMSAGGGISIGSSTNVQVNTCLMNSGDGFRCSGSDVWVGNSTINSMSMNSSEVTVARAIVNDFVQIDNTSATNRALNILQCTITNNYVYVAGGFGRILYSQLMRLVQEYSANTVILGNRISTDKAWESCVSVQGGGKAVIRNNDIAHPSGFDGHAPGMGGGVRIDNCETLVANNYIHDLAGGSWEGQDDRDGVYVQNGSSKIEIVGNVFWGTYHPVWSGYDNVTYRYNDDVEGLNRHGGGVIAEAIIAQNPLFVDKAGGNYQLATNSPCINAGPPEAWYKDRDSTRNDMGLFGGSAYDPEGKTTDKPITFLLQASPLTVIKGVHTNLTISGGGIVIGK